MFYYPTVASKTIKQTNVAKNYWLEKKYMIKDEITTNEDYCIQSKNNVRD